LHGHFKATQIATGAEEAALPMSCFCHLNWRSGEAEAGTAAGMKESTLWCLVKGNVDVIAITFAEPEKISKQGRSSCGQEGQF